MSKKLTKDIFVERSIKAYGNKYDYSNVEYKSIDEKVCIICPEHGEFWQTPNKHLQGHGCPKCKQSHLERCVMNMLEKNNIKYIQQHTFKWLKYKNMLYVDFYLPDYNVVIECQGEQHFKMFGWENNINKLILRQKRDIIKKQLCEINNINILYYADDTVIIPNNFVEYKIIKTLDELLKIIKKQVVS